MRGELNGTIRGSRKTSETRRSQFDVVPDVTRIYRTFATDTAEVSTVEGELQWSMQYTWEGRLPLHVSLHVWQSIRGEITQQDNLQGL